MGEPTPPGLVLTGLAHAYDGPPVLRDTDLTVPVGTFAAVLGPSGCGKTTLLRLVAGFERPASGSIAVGGRQVAGRGVHVPPEKRSVGVVPQEGALFPHLSVQDNVGFGLARAQRRGDRVREVLALVGLADLATRMPHELSGGQQQRVAVARALAPRPALVLLDEPFSALDAALRAELRADVRSAVRADGATAVLVTHDQQEALSTADLVAVLRNGRVVQAAAPAVLYRAPVDLGVGCFVGESVVLPGTALDAGVRTALGVLPVSGSPPAPGADVSVLLRPEQLSLESDPGVGVPAGGVPGRVVASEFQGADTVVTVELSGVTEGTVRDGSGGTRETVTVRERSADRLPGDRVRVGVTGTGRAFPALRRTGGPL
ncbi:MULTISPECIES: ABC transporter ATP-binding protein [unclassified Modestobacter]